MSRQRIVKGKGRERREEIGRLRHKTMVSGQSYLRRPGWVEALYNLGGFQAEEGKSFSREGIGGGKEIDKRLVPAAEPGGQ